MRSFSLFATTIVTFACLCAACGEDLDTSVPEQESSGAALVSRMPDRSPRSAQRIDLSRPGAEVRIDSSDESDLRSIEIVTEDGTTIVADDLIRGAAKNAGISPKAGGSFMLRSRPIGPGHPTCSPRTQTDCCACGFWSSSIGIPPFCQALWCPCTGTGCSGDVLQAK
jgi:hypothetical protein